MDTEPNRIAVIGVPGFVGQHLARALRTTGWSVHGVTSSRNSFLLEHLGIPAAEGKFPVVINLAYPTGTSPLRRRKDNASIIARIREFAAPGAVIVHASTLAVFGFSLEREPVCGPIRWRPDQDYIESKVWMENQLVDALAGNHRVDIVRLGNVWGPGSVHWLAGMASRLRTSLPTLAEGGGYSNVTDVHNVVSYFESLARRTETMSGAFYHHLAEFSSESWDTFVTPVSKFLGCEPVSAFVPPAPKLASFLFGKVAVEALKAINDSRGPGSLLRQILNQLPESSIARMRREKLAAATGGYFEEPVLAKVLGCQREFRSQTLSGWTPPLSLAESLSRAVSWLDWAGYSSSLK